MNSEVYIQEKDTGEYYIGKNETGRKNYQGSGVKFKASYEKDPSRWTKHSIASNLTPNLARWLERCLVGPEVVEDPMSYNLTVGGYGGNRINWTDDKRKAKSEWAKKHAVNNLPKIPHNKGTAKPRVNAKDDPEWEVWNKGKSQYKVECPHCGKIGAYTVMGRWHMDNCKHRRN